MSRKNTFTFVPAHMLRYHGLTARPDDLGAIYHITYTKELAKTFVPVPDTYLAVTKTGSTVHWSFHLRSNASSGSSSSDLKVTTSTVDIPTYDPTTTTLNVPTVTAHSSAIPLPSISVTDGTMRHIAQDPQADASGYMRLYFDDASGFHVTRDVYAEATTPYVASIATIARDVPVVDSVDVAQTAHTVVTSLRPTTKTLTVVTDVSTASAESTSITPLPSASTDVTYYYVASSPLPYSINHDEVESLTD